MSKKIRTFTTDSSFGSRFEIEEGEKMGTWVRSDGDRERSSFVGLEYALTETAKGRWQEITPKPVYPRYFVAGKNQIDNAAYIRFDSGLKSVAVMADGSTRWDNMYDLNCSDNGHRREITKEQAEALVTPVKPTVRYFVPITGYSGIDHVRCTGNVSVWINTDGEEEPSCFPLSEFVNDKGFKEVHPESSESLRRSHRYAEKYNEGKAAGKQEAQKEIEELKFKLETAKFHTENYRKSNETYGAAFKTVEQEKAKLKQQLEDLRKKARELAYA